MKKILIVNANYYKDISDNLILCVKKELNKKKFKLKIINVPGVFEIPFIIRKNIKKFDGFITLGCVIKGKTPHFDLICNSVFNSILQISIIFNKPIGNGIITCLNLNQAKERSGLKSNKVPNKGKESAKAIISVLKNEPKNT